VSRSSRPADSEPGATRVAARALLRAALSADGAAGPHLLVQVPGGEERIVPLQDCLSIGRSLEAGLRLPDPDLSRLHARVRLTSDGQATIQDLGSKNGSRVGTRRLHREPVPLRPGDRVILGGTWLRFVDPIAPPAGGDDGDEADVTSSRPQVSAGLPGSARPRSPLAALLLVAAAALLALAAVVLALAG
jgi:hypothetical protein